MSNKDAARLRAAWIPHARGKVLEVGIGSGLNLPFYSADVQHLYGVEPSFELQRMARKKTAGRPFGVDFLTQSAEEALPFAVTSIDTVVTTWTLCSIPDASKALQEMKRVLKTGGRLIFWSMAVLPSSRDRLAGSPDACEAYRRWLPSQSQTGRFITEAGFRIGVEYALSSWAALVTYT